MKILCFCREFENEFLEESAENVFIYKRTLMIESRLLLKRVCNSLICYCCKEKVFRIDGLNLYYQPKSIKPSFENYVDSQLLVTSQEKVLFQEHLENRFERELKEKKEFYDRKIDELLLEFQNWKHSATEMVEKVKNSLVVEQQVQECKIIEGHDTGIFSRGDEIFEFEDLNNEQLAPFDLPSDNESANHELIQSNAHPLIFGSLPIQINSQRNINLQEEGDKGFEPPHVFAARTYQDTGAIAGSIPNRRISFL